jgi:hypothetical protein
LLITLESATCSIKSRLDDAYKTGNVTEQVRCDSKNLQNIHAAIFEIHKYFIGRVDDTQPGTITSQEFCAVLRSYITNIRTNDEFYELVKDNPLPAIIHTLKTGHFTLSPKWPKIVSFINNPTKSSALAYIQSLEPILKKQIWILGLIVQLSRICIDPVIVYDGEFITKLQHWVDSNLDHMAPDLHP